MAECEKLRMIAQSGRIARLYVQRDKYTHIYINIHVDSEDLDNSIEKGVEGMRKATRALIRVVERECPLCRVWSEVSISNMIHPPLGRPMRVAQND